MDAYHLSEHALIWINTNRAALYSRTKFRGGNAAPEANLTARLTLTKQSAPKRARPATNSAGRFFFVWSLVKAA
jgi:hypothetical protein